MRSSAVLLLFVSILFTSCAVDMNSRPLWDSLRESELQLEVSGRAKIERPIRLGIVPPLRTSHNRWGPRRVQFEAWTDEERGVVRRWAKKFKERGVIEEVVFLPRLLMGTQVDQELLPSLRNAALASGVDAILITHSLSDTGEQMNVLALLDLTLVGMFVFPAHHARAMTVAEGVVLDARTNQVYAFAEGQGDASSTTALAYVDKGDLVREARVDSLDKLGEALFADVERQVWQAQGLKARQPIRSVQVESAVRR